MTASNPVLVVAEHDHVSIKTATLNTVAAALQCGGEVHVLVAGHQAGGAAKAAAAIGDVARVLHADAPQLADGLAENVAAQIVALAARYTHILFPATSAGKNVAPRVAALLDVAQVSDIVRVVGADTFVRSDLRGQCAGDRAKQRSSKGAYRARDRLRCCRGRRRRGADLKRSMR